MACASYPPENTAGGLGSVGGHHAACACFDPGEVPLGRLKNGVAQLPHSSVATDWQPGCDALLLNWPDQRSRKPRA